MASCTTHQRLMTLPNLVTLVRPVCTLPFVRLCAEIQPAAGVWLRVGVVLLFMLIVSSDVLDGWLARRRCQESSMGRILDHVCDVLFILTALTFFVSRNLAPWWLPASIAWAFALYAIDSWWRTAGQAQHALIGSRVGHLGGTLYHTTVGMVTGNLCLDGTVLSTSLMYPWFLAIALLALISGLERLMLLGCALAPQYLAGLHAESQRRSTRSEP